MSRRFAFLLIAVSLALLSAPDASIASPQGQLEGSGIPYGDEIGALVHAPKGWIFDNQSGVSQGLHCVMYPQGFSWRTAREVIYVSIGKLKTGESLADFVAKDAEDFRTKSPAIEIVALEPISLVTGEVAEVRRFTGDQFGNHECVAYAQLGDSVASFSLSCRSKDGYEKSVGPFKDMVASAVLIKMSFADKAPPRPEKAGMPSRGLYGYSHWARFKPGTFVSFRYTMESAQASEEMAKTITLKEVTPGFVRLEFQEAPAAAGGSVKGPALLYQHNQMDFGEAEEEFEKDYPVESLLGYGIAGYLEAPQARPIGGGQADVDWKGGKLPATWTKLKFESGAGPMTITVWRCGSVPGGLFKFVREFEGAAASREEVVVSDFRAIGASPAEVERLRATRVPVTIEAPAGEYFQTRCRLIDRLKNLATAVVTLQAGGPGEEPSLLAMASSDLLQNLDLIKVEFDADRQKIAAELGPQEAAKLAPVFGLTEALLAIQLKITAVAAKVEEKAAGGALDEAGIASLTAEMKDLVDQRSVAGRRWVAALAALDGISVRFLKKPK